MKNQPGKAPAIQWYYKDWLSDARLQAVSASTRGIWMNLLMFMIDCAVGSDDCPDGELSNLTTAKLAKLGGSSEAEAELFIEEALEWRFCDVICDSHGNVTVMSRRISRESDARAKARERKRKQRRGEDGKFSGHSDVPSMEARAPSPTPTPTADKRLKTSSRKGSPSPSKSKPKTPAPSSAPSKHFSSIIPTELLTKIENACRASSEAQNGTISRWNPYQWVQHCSNQNSHPEAVLYCLESHIKYHKSQDIKNPWSYCNTIMKTKGQMYNESKYIKEAHAFAKEMAAAGGSIARLRELAEGIGE